jgi:hypothetical protein
VAADEIERAAIARQPFLEAFARIIDHHIGTEPFDERLPARRGCRRDVGTQVFRDLDRERRSTLLPMANTVPTPSLPTTLGSAGRIG